MKIKRRSSSVEKQAQAALRRAVIWRIVGDALALPKQLINAIAVFFSHLEMAVFAIECDAARKYRLLTGVDLGVATNNPGRYLGTDSRAYEQEADEAFSEVDED